MIQYVVSGPTRLYGECRVQGAKNSALPVLAASLLAQGESVFGRIPAISDVDATLEILKSLGCRIRFENGEARVDAADAAGTEIPDALMRELRSSVIFLGAILARFGSVRLSMPGGCEIGQRPIDLHLHAMRKLGAAVDDAGGRIVCTAPGGLTGADIRLSFPSVGATENVMIAAATAKGTTTVYNAAREPEISDLADCLNGMGASITGAGESTIVIEGVKKLRPARHTVLPDRIVAGTLLSAAAMTGGEITLRHVVPAHLGPVVEVLEQAGCRVESDLHTLHLVSPRRLRAVGHVRTMPYPGFPTDLQAIVTAALCTAAGTSVVTETIFESRFRYIGELTRFGAVIRTDGRMAVIEGVERLTPTGVAAPDLRGGAALLLAALAADGESVICNGELIERGYEDPAATFGALGAGIKREVCCENRGCENCGGGSEADA